jgi:hypothetical protein
MIGAEGFPDLAAQSITAKAHYAALVPGLGYCA